MNGAKGGEGSRSLGGCLTILAGVAILIVACLCYGFSPDELCNYVDVPSVAIVGGLTFCGWLIFPGFRGSLRALRLLMRGRTECPEEARRAMWFCAGGIGLSFTAGVLGTLIGVINMLSGGMDSPAVLTSGAAVAMITNLYPCLIAVVLLGLYFRARRILQATLERPGAAEVQAAPLRGGWFRFVAAFLVFVYSAVVLGTGFETLANFIELQAIAFTCGSLLLGWLITPGFKQWGGIISVLYRNRIVQDADKDNARAALDACKLGMRLVFFGGLAGATAGVVRVMIWAATLPQGLTSGMALLCLSLFWVALLTLPLLAFANRARGLLGAEAQEPERIELGWAGLLAGCSTLLALLGLLLLFASFAMTGFWASPAAGAVAKVWHAMPYDDGRALCWVVGFLLAGWLMCGLPLRGTFFRFALWITMLGGVSGAVLRLIQVLAIGMDSLRQLLEQFAIVVTPFFWALLLLVPLAALQQRLGKVKPTDPAAPNEYR